MRSKSTWLAWLVAGGVAAAAAVQLNTDLALSPGFINDAGAVVWAIGPVVFATCAAIILARRPGHPIGWLLMIPAAVAIPGAIVEKVIPAEAPQVMSLELWASLWFYNWSWLLVIFPVFHLLMVFPTGNLPSARWRWLAAFEAFMFLLLVALIAVQNPLGPFEGTWAIDNPIGFVPAAAFDSLFTGLWTAGLVILAIGSLVAFVVRFRRTRAETRLQMKWVLFAVSLFALIYVVLAVDSGFEGNGVGSVILGAALAGIPASITAAVLRYRLFDIDLIIRRTVVYAILTGLLAGIYVGSVVLLQTVLGDRLGESSSLTVAISTLLIAAVFSPLRRRLQSWVNRRLFRSPYDPEIVLTDFASALQSQAHLDPVSGELMAVIDATLQPATAGLWIHEQRENLPTR